MSIKSSLTGGAACRVSVHAHVVLSKPVLLYELKPILLSQH